MPDLIVLLPRGKGVVFFEVKSGAGKMRPAQQAFAEACTNAMVTYACGGELEAKICLGALGLL